MAKKVRIGLARINPEKVEYYEVEARPYLVSSVVPPISSMICAAVGELGWAGLLLAADGSVITEQACDYFLVLHYRNGSVARYQFGEGKLVSTEQVERLCAAIGEVNGASRFM